MKTTNDDVDKEIEPLDHNHAKINGNHSDKYESNHRCFRCYQPCLTKFNPLPPQPSMPQRLCHAVRCPPHGLLGRLLTSFVVIICLYGLLFVLVGKDEALPGHCRSVYQNFTANRTVNGSTEAVEFSNLKEICTGNLFGLFTLFVCAMIGGFVVGGFLPPLLGMMVVGFLLRNVPYINFARGISKSWSSVLRNIALCIILIRAGMGLEPAVLRRLSGAVFRLAFTPCLVETLVVGIVSHLLMGLPLKWGFMLGFVLAAVSPAVVVPSMLRLEERRLGTNKGIPTLVIASASVDDVLAITGFGVTLAITFSESDLVVTLLRGPLEALLGVVYGLAVGPFLWFIPNKSNEHFLFYRFIILFGSCLIALLGSGLAGVPGAGALACLSVSFMAAVGWRQRDEWIDNKNPLSEVFGILWWIAQPFLFGLIGAEVKIEALNNNVVGWGILTLFIGLFFRMAASFLAVLGAGFSMRERFFIAVAWLPKATVQAAIGPIAFDTALRRENQQEIALGLSILTCAVLAILITAPIGAFLIDLSAPRLLSQESAADIQKQEEEDEEEV